MILTHCTRACDRHVCLLDPRLLGNERRPSFCLQAREPGAVRLVYCPRAHQAQGLHRVSRDWCRRGTSRRPGETKRPAPSITSASPPTPKRKKRNCPFDIAQRNTMMGAESVQVICPDDETPHLEDKIVSLINTCARSKTLLSLDLLVCPRRPPRRKCG